MEHENSQIEMASFQCEESVSDLRRSFRDTLQVKGNESGLPIVILKFRGVSRELCQDVLRRWKQRPTVTGGPHLVLMCLCCRPAPYVFVGITIAQAGVRWSGNFNVMDTEKNGIHISQMRIKIIMQRHSSQSWGIRGDIYAHLSERRKSGPHTHTVEWYASYVALPGNCIALIEGTSSTNLQCFGLGGEKMPRAPARQAMASQPHRKFFLQAQLTASNRQCHQTSYSVGEATDCTFSWSFCAAYRHNHWSLRYVTPFHGA